jgi:uncharacterized protein involved in response to NO
VTERVDPVSIVRKIPLTAQASVPAQGAVGDAVSGLAELSALMSSAPHRLMFFGGASAVIVTMLWWACVLAATRFGWAHMPIAPVPPGWAHAVLTQYGMLPMFFFGFLLTVFPRWMNQMPFTRRAYVPVFVGVFGGYLVANAGMLAGRGVLIAGLALMLAGYSVGLAALGRVLWANRAKNRSALSCYVALLIGALGLATFLAFVLGAPAQCAIVSIKIGTFGLLLPVFFTVCHRMIPFFSNNVASNYRMVRPEWSLPLLWLLALGHLGLELDHRSAWLWLTDLPLAAFFAWHWFAWQPWKAMRPGLLAVLYLAFAWLPIAFSLFAAQSLIEFSSDDFVWGRIPLHVLTVGFFGSMLVAMVTRVTQGHAGRPLEMGLIPWVTFGALQVVVLLRVWAELATDTWLWLTIAAFAWVAAFLPWVLRSLWIYATPRLDGKPG